MAINPTGIPLPRILQVAHWLHEQQRLVSAREAAEVLGCSVWSMGHIFSKIRLLPDIMVINEQTVRSKGGQQLMIRIVHIYPYTLDEKQHPHRRRDDTDQPYPLTWHDLLC